MIYEYNYFYTIIVEVQAKIFAATIYNCVDKCLHGISGVAVAHMNWPIANKSIGYSCLILLV